MEYCRASLGWFDHEPEWYEADHATFAHTEAQSVSLFVQFLQSQLKDTPLNESSNRSGGENGNSLLDM